MAEQEQCVGTMPRKGPGPAAIIVLPSGVNIGPTRAPAGSCRSAGEGAARAQQGYEV